MRILVTGTTLNEYSKSMAKSFQQLGHTVMFVNMLEFYIQCNYAERTLYKWGAKFLEENYTKKWNEEFLNICVDFRPDIVFIVNGMVIEHFALQQLNERGIKIILWMIDSIKRLKEHEGKLKYYDSIYSFEGDDIPYLKEKYGLSAYYCPVGFDEDAYYPDKTIKRDIDICFVGNRAPNRSATLRRVAEYVRDKSLVMRVYGVWWDKRYFWKKMKFVKKYTPLERYVSNNLIAASQVGEIYRRSKICLNIHAVDHTGLNPRSFEVLATRSFELMDERKTDGLLRPGTDLVMYAGIDDLLNKIDYYLANEQEREMIASNGYEWVKSRYTIKQMAKNMIEPYTG